MKEDTIVQPRFFSSSLPDLLVWSLCTMRPLLIDIHTHIYTPRLMQLLRNRTVNPRVHSLKGKEKLAILPEEVDGGRPVGPQFWDRASKLEFMNRHGIDASVISIANVSRSPPSAGYLDELTLAFYLAFSAMARLSTCSRCDYSSQ